MTKCLILQLIIDPLTIIIFIGIITIIVASCCSTYYNCYNLFCINYIKELLKYLKTYTYINYTRLVLHFAFNIYIIIVEFIPIKL